MVLALLIAQVEHGPAEGMAVVHLVVLAIVVLGGLGFALVVRGARKGPGGDLHGVADRDADRDRGSDA